MPRFLVPVTLTIEAADERAARKSAEIDLTYLALTTENVMGYSLPPQHAITATEEATP